MFCELSPLRLDFRNRRYLSAATLALAALIAMGLVAAQPTEAQNETLLHSFKGKQDGELPGAGVIRDSAGNVYGTTSYGGDFGNGTVFKLSPRHGKTTLYNFHGKEDGSLPNADLLRDPAGNIYSTTQLGGDLTCDNGLGCGTAFVLSATGHETAVHRFSGPTTDGSYPVAGLVGYAKGNFLGATPLGGAANVGTVFQVDDAGKETVLYSFTGGNGGPDGANPNSLIRDSAGNLYGTTEEGGSQSAGTVFKLDASGNETVLYTFTYGHGGTDGSNPMGVLARDAAGNLYGVTNGGGTNNLGTIFRIDPSGTETILHSFGLPGDGAYPQYGMVMDKAGNLYGNTSRGGSMVNGAVFKYDISTGKITILHSFGGTGDGDYPVGRLTLDAAGNIYGVTQKGGTAGWGTVYKITP
jgi:uncharacterized repeat protein (TIGR03803 family)